MNKHEEIVEVLTSKIIVRTLESIDSVNFNNMEDTQHEDIKEFILQALQLIKAESEWTDKKLFELFKQGYETSIITSKKTLRQNFDEYMKNREI